MPLSKKRKRLSKSKLREIRRKQQLKLNRRGITERARAERKRLEWYGSLIPEPIRNLFAFVFGTSVYKPTLLRFSILALAMILTTGAHTVSGAVRTLGKLAPGHLSSYCRLFSCSPWSSYNLSRRLLAFLLHRFVPDGPICIAADDTVDEHPGDQVHGKGCHRDAVRSSRSYTAFRWGHKWLVVAVMVWIKGAIRPWLLPFFVVLCTTAAFAKENKRRHKSPAQILKQVLLLLHRWFPHRTFICAADGAFACHDVARILGRRNRYSAAVAEAQEASGGEPSERPAPIHLVSKFYSDAALYQPPPPVQLKANGKRKSSGRPRVKGDKMDSPEEVVIKTKERKRLDVAWYGGGRRVVDVVSSTGHWYKAGQGLIEVRWVYVKDVEGTHRDEYFFSTDVTMSEKEIIEHYVRRWNLETTFEEMRAYMGLETTRGWKKKTVERMAPMLFCLYSVVVCLYTMMPEEYREKGRVEWEGKEHLTYSDAIRSVRMWLWAEWIIPCHGQTEAFKNLPEEFQEVLLAGLAPAA